MSLEIPKRDEETAEFNSAFAFLERLNQVEYLIENALMNWDLKGAFSFLETYENELDYSFNDNEREEVTKIKKEIIEIFNNNIGIGEQKYNKLKRSYQIIGINQTGNLRNKLIELNKLLRRIKHKKGLGMPSRGQGKLF